MGSILDKIGLWLHDLLVAGVMDNLKGLVNSVNAEVVTASTEVGKTPQAFAPGIFSMVRNVSESVIVPIAGIILTVIACVELIRMIMEYNNLANFETWFIFKWIFKTFVAVTVITHTFDITMAIFDVAHSVVMNAGGIISGTTSLSGIDMTKMYMTVENMGNGELIGLYLQSSVITITLFALSKIIFVIVYARMIEIYLMTSLAPIPMATFGNREQSQIGQNYLRSLAALGFQGFLIILCVGIYAVLVQNMALSADIVDSLWGIVGYTILLCFTLFKTGSLAKSVFSAH